MAFPKSLAEFAARRLQAARPPCIPWDTGGSAVCFFPAELSVLHMQPDIGGLGHLGIVGHHDDAALLLVGQPLESLHDHPPVVAVQTAGGLVGQDHPAARRQGPGDGHPLLLAAGQLIGKLPEIRLPDAHIRQPLPGQLQGLFLVHFLQPQGIAHVFLRRQQRKQVEILIDHRHRVPPQGAAVHEPDGLLVQGDLPLRGQLQPR